MLSTVIDNIVPSLSVGMTTEKSGLSFTARSSLLRRDGAKQLFGELYKRVRLVGLHARGLAQLFAVARRQLVQVMDAGLAEDLLGALQLFKSPDSQLAALEHRLADAHKLTVADW